MNFIAFTYAPKQKNPYTGEWDNKYLVPKVSDQQGKILGKSHNFIVVTCSPSMNGVYKYPVEKMETYGRWINKKTECLYVPVDDCEFCLFENLPDSKWKSIILEEVKRQQEEWYNGQVENNPKKYPNGKPDWMIQDDK